MRKAIRVVYCVTNPDRLSGSNRSLLELISKLPKQIEPIIIVSRDGMFSEECRNRGVRVLKISLGKVFSNPKVPLRSVSKLKLAWAVMTEFISFTLRLRKSLKELKPDIVHTNDPKGTLFVGVTARLAGCPLVTHLRGEKPFGPIVSWFYEKLPDSIISVSKATTASLNQVGSGKSTTVYNGVSDVAHLGSCLNWPVALRESGVLNICCFASVVPFKGYHHLLKAMSLLNERGFAERIHLYCIGDFVISHRKYQRWLLKLQQDLKLQNVTFTGWQTDPYSFYRVADIAVLPSISREILCIDNEVMRVYGSEGLPRMNLEAMWFEIPIVASDVGGVREQVQDEVNGFVVPPGNHQILANKLTCLIESRALREQMGKKGRKMVAKHFSAEQYVSGILSVYSSLGVEVEVQ